MNRWHSMTGWIVLAMLMTAGPTLADGLGGANVATQPIPEHLQGRFPIQMPTYEGDARQLLLLSNRWVIVVTGNMQTLYQEINSRSDGELDEQVKLWARSEAEGKPHWGAYRRRWAIVDEHKAAAREAIGERRLQETQTYSITSPNDRRYADAKHPTRVDSLLVSMGQDRSHGGAFNIEYAHYNYIEFPEPMQQGKQYSIRVDDKNNSRVSFTYDENTLVSRAIKINQAGYLPDAPRNLAYLGAYLYEHGPLNADHAQTFEVVNVETGDVAYQGEIKLIERDPHFGTNEKNPDPAKRPSMYGEDVYMMDFSDLDDEGVFFIRVGGVGRSWPFVHRADAMNEVFYTAARALYHQRAGVPVEKQFTPWTRQAARVNPVYKSENIEFPPHVVNTPKGFDRFDVIGGSIDRSEPPQTIIGGWHDAADWDRNQAHFTIVFDLLNAYEMAPEKFKDNQLNLPESGNGVPDLLDEVRFGLDMWRQCMNDDGGVSTMIETWTHPKIDDDKVDYTLSTPTRWGSLIFAAGAAQYAKAIRKYNPDDAKLFEEAAKKAFAFGTDPNNALGELTINAKRKRGQGDPYTLSFVEKDEYLLPYLLHAKLQMYRLTGDEAYLADVPEIAANAHPPYEWRFGRQDWSPWIYYSILQTRDALPNETVEHWQNFFLKDADERVDMLGDAPYRHTWPRYQDYWLGWAASHATTFNRAMAIAYELTGDAKYRDAMVANTDFMLGANPMGMSWMPGVGFVYPIDIQHAMSENDGIMDPVPGIMIYGITGGPIWHQFREKVWVAPAPEGEDGKVVFVEETQRNPPLWRRWMVHPHTNVAKNEFTVQQTVSPMIFSAAMLMDENWTPDERLLNRQPRDESALFGQYYLP